jgi:hypothetical protein
MKEVLDRGQHNNPKDCGTEAGLSMTVNFVTIVLHRSSSYKTCKTKMLYSIGYEKKALQLSHTVALKIAQQQAFLGQDFMDL